MKYIINGGKQLSGEVKISGNKNSIFPCVAAAMLTSDQVILENVSDLKDTQILIQILEDLGVKVKRDKSTLFIEASDIRRFSLPKDLMSKLRGSIVLVGAILSRMGKVNFYHPGGDIIGRRSIETHLMAFIDLGATFKATDSKFTLFFPENGQSSEDCELFLREASVTATENLILVSILGKRTITLRNCAKEPHIIDLCNMLMQMGAKISGVGSDTIKIIGVEKLGGTRFKIGADFIEVGTYIVAAAITGGEIKISGLDETDLDPIIVPFREFGINIEKGKEILKVSVKRLKSPSKLTTNIWPGFPTDLMSVAIVLATQSKGVILCHDWVYESRMFFVDKLISMGANITLADPHRVLVYGQTRLRARVLDTPDIRAGMSLVLAALVGKGKSVINQSELIERGYENVLEKLKGIGADIQRDLV